MDRLSFLYITVSLTEREWIWSDWTNGQMDKWTGGQISLMVVLTMNFANFASPYFIVTVFFGTGCLRVAVG